MRPFSAVAPILSEDRLEQKSKKNVIFEDKL